MRKFWLVAVGAVLAIMALAGTLTRADERRVVRAALTGFQEVPAISTAAQGQFQARLDESMIEYELSYSNLQAPALFAHIHLGQRGVNGGVIAFLCGGGNKPACPTPGGSVSGTITAADIVGPGGQGIAAGEFEEALQAIRSGNTYANVHSTLFPGGEIRGQIRTDNETNPH